MEKNTILVVDDERQVVRTISRILLDNRYRIITAASGEEGLFMLEEYRVDLIISDVNMPGMGGLEFLKRVRIDFPDILTLVLTGHGDLDMAMAAINDIGVYKFILKPFKSDELRITARRALEFRKAIIDRDLLQRGVIRQEVALKEIEREFPGVTKIEKDEDGWTLF